MVFKNDKKKIYVLDTNVLLLDYKAIYEFEGEIIVPVTVLEELDKFKSFENGIGFNARRAVREIVTLLHSGDSPKKGVRLPNGSTFRIKVESEISKLPKNLDKKKNDNKIIDSVLALSQSNKAKEVILVTCDSNMTAIAMSLGISVSNYAPKIGNYGEGSKVYKGVQSIVVPDAIVDDLQSDKPVILPPQKNKITKNEFLILRSVDDNKKTAMARFLEIEKPLRKIFTSKTVSFSGISPRNKEQRLYVDLLTDPSIELVTAIGTAGSGKTLLALASGLSQVIDDNKIYSRLIVTRPVQPFGKDIGYLPGLKEEKMREWLAPIWDNLYEILGGSKKNRTIAGHRSIQSLLEEYLEQGIVEVEALTYIKGRSIANAFIIVDEAQDLTEDMLKRILTRVGNNSKLVLTGDVSQIDNNNISPYDSDFVNVIHKMSDRPNVGHITLTKGERSSIANIAAEVL